MTFVATSVLIPTKKYGLSSKQIKAPAWSLKFLHWNFKNVHAFKHSCSGSGGKTEKARNFSIEYRSEIMDPVRSSEINFVVLWYIQGWLRSRKRTLNPQKASWIKVKQPESTLLCLMLIIRLFMSRYLRRKLPLSLKITQKFRYEKEII